MQASVFPGPKDSETANQVVPPDPSLYKEEVPALHSGSPICGNHTFLNNGGQLPNSSNSENLPTTPRVASCELSSQERGSALLRYKEKKKTRRYQDIHCFLYINPSLNVLMLIKKYHYLSS